jgi:hypothetical protein
MEQNEYDGLFWTHETDEEENSFLKISYFAFQEEYANGVSISTNLGDWYHITFFKFNEEGNPYLSDNFEAILGDPSEYVKNFKGSDLYGCIIRKTNLSEAYMKKYLKTFENYGMM